jgi:hypothetical protein
LAQRYTLYTYCQALTPPDQVIPVSSKDRPPKPYQVTQFMVDDEGVLCDVTLSAASSMHRYIVESPYMGIPYWRMMTMSFSLLGALFWSMLLVKGLEVGATSSYIVFSGDVKSFLAAKCYTQSCMV